MAIQRSVLCRNAQLDVVETIIGTAPKLQIRTGSVPANCAAASTGTLLAEITLPSDWQSAASGGTKTKLGTWTVNAIATGTAAHYRIFDSAGTTCHEQATVSATGGGGDMEVDNTSIASGQPVTVTTWTRTMGGA